MISREDALKIAQGVVDYEPQVSPVETAHVLAQFLLYDETTREQLVDNLTSVQARCTDLLEERRTLARLIEKIAAETSSDRRDVLVAEALTAARGGQ